MIQGNHSRDVQIIQSFVRFCRIRKRLIISLLIITLITCIILSGIFTVPLNQMGAMFLFGKLQRDDIAPGIHFKLPKPIQRVEVMNTAEIRSLKITKDRSSSISLVTGDENIIIINIAVQYVITHYGKYITGGENWEDVLNQAAMTGLTKLIASMKVDEVLTTGKSLIQNGLQEIAQERLDEYNAGITIFSTTIENIQPPGESRDSFRMVSNARNEKAEKISIAESNRNRQLSNARGEAEGIIRQAEAEAEEIIKKAKGEIERYKAVLTEYRRAKEITERDYYLTAMEHIIENATILLLQPDQIDTLDLNIFIPDGDGAQPTERLDTVSEGYSGKPTLPEQVEPQQEEPLLITDEDELRSLYRQTLGRVISGD